MFTERKNYNLKTLNYLFLKMGIKTNLFAISNIYERHWSDKSLEGILNELSIAWNSKILKGEVLKNEEKKDFHIDRTPRCNCDHRDSCGTAAACARPEGS